MAYIDLNMVRARVVKHPSEWPFSGYNEIQKPPRRNSLIDRKSLMELCFVKDEKQLRVTSRETTEEVLARDKMNREAKWSESLAIGDRSYIEDTKEKLGVKGKGRKIIESSDDYVIREPQNPYEVYFRGEMGTFSGCSQAKSW